MARYLQTLLVRAQGYSSPLRPEPSAAPSSVEDPFEAVAGPAVPPAAGAPPEAAAPEPSADPPLRPEPPARRAHQGSADALPAPPGATPVVIRPMPPPQALAA